MGIVGIDRRDSQWTLCRIRAWGPGLKSTKGGDKGKSWPRRLKQKSSRKETRREDYCGSQEQGVTERPEVHAASGQATEANSGVTGETWWQWERGGGAEGKLLFGRGAVTGLGGGAGHSSRDCPPHCPLRSPSKPDLHTLLFDSWRVHLKAIPSFTKLSSHPFLHQGYFKVIFTSFWEGMWHHLKIYHF